MKIKLLKAIDNFGGRLLLWMLTRPKTTTVSRPRSFLVIRPGGIGDAVLLIPTLISLKRRFPCAIIHVLAEKRNSAAFSLCNCIDRIFHYDTPRDLLNAVRGSYDVVIDTEQWHRLSAAAARLNNAPVLVGFATNERKKMFTHPIPYAKDDFEIRTFLNLLTPITGVEETPPILPFLLISSKSRERARVVLQSLVGRKVVVIFPGGSIAEKRWGAVKFRELATQLASRSYGVVVVGGKDDIKVGKEIIVGLSNALNFCGKLSLSETAAVIKESNVLITGDSGIMHIGFGLGIKVLALFGPGSGEKWAPRGRNCKVINKKLACSPCMTFGYIPKCRLNAECMKQITSDEVFREAIELLEER